MSGNPLFTQNYIGNALIKLNLYIVLVFAKKTDGHQLKDLIARQMIVL